MSKWFNPLYWKVTINQNDWNPFLSFVFQNDWLQNHCWLWVKSTTPFVRFVSALLPASLLPYWCRVCHICAFIFEDIVALLDAETNKWVQKLVCGRDQDIRNDQVKFAAKNIKVKYMYNACKLSVKRGVTFCVVLYRNRWPVNLILHFAESHIGIYIRYKYFAWKLFNQM